MLVYEAQLTGNHVYTTAINTLLLSLALSLHTLSLGRVKRDSYRADNKTVPICNVLTVIFQELLYLLYTILRGELDTCTSSARKDIQNKLCEGCEPRDFKALTFWTRYPLAVQGSAPGLCLTAAHMPQQPFHPKSSSGSVTSGSPRLGRGAHTSPHPTRCSSRPGRDPASRSWVPAPSPELGGLRGCTCFKVEAAPAERLQQSCGHLLRPEPLPEPDLGRTRRGRHP